MTLITHTDIWLLLAILIAGPDGASLKQIISTGDAINHSIFTYEEIENGLSRLRANELIDFKNQNVYPTEKASQPFNEAKPHSASWLTVLEKLNTRFGAVDGPLLAANKTDFFSKQAYDDALSEYHKEMREFAISSLQSRHGVSRAEAEQIINGAVQWQRRSADQ